MPNRPLRSLVPLLLDTTERFYCLALPVFWTLDCSLVSWLFAACLDHRLCFCLLFCLALDIVVCWCSTLPALTTICTIKIAIGSYPCCHAPVLITHITWDIGIVLLSLLNSNVQHWYWTESTLNCLELNNEISAFCRTVYSWLIIISHCYWSELSWAA